ncbi:MAG: hypothetical protein HZA90_24340 [Verrucomicrobia bacterium]|nr:hypothetical protein [Verrucomicrobiota bacterium]
MTTSMLHRYYDFSDAALVLIGHGSTKNAASTATTYQHGEELRRRKIFREVAECFWMVEPKVHEVLDRLRAPRVFLMPLFLSDGYFTQEALPAALGLKTEDQTGFARVQQRGGKTLHFCHPVGTHRKITEVILARAQDVVACHPFPRPPPPSDIALFLAAHGTTQSDESRAAVDQQAEAIRAMGLYAEVHSVFLEEPPFIGDCYALGRAPNFVLVPFFMADGLHTAEDIPIRLGESTANVQARLQTGQSTWRNPTEKHGKRVWVSRCVGTEPILADLILERMREVAGVSTLAETIGP